MLTDEQIKNLTRFHISSIEQELIENHVSKSRIKDIVNFYKKVFGTDRNIYCISAYNEIGKNAFEGLQYSEYKTIPDEYKRKLDIRLNNFKCYGSKNIINLSSQCKKLDGKLIMVIEQHYDIIDSYTFHNYDKNKVYYVTAKDVDEIIGT